jgi:AraC-like DNA-binding protein
VVDRDAEIAEEPVTDATTAGVVRATLEQLRLEGAIFFRSELTDGFAFESAPLELVDALNPGGDRLLLFHIVAAGSCWVSVEDGVRHWARAGDVIVLPYADRYRMGGRSPAEAASILAMLDPLPWTDLPVLRLGGGGERTDVVCGYLHSRHPLFDPRLRALPAVFVVRPSEGAAAWVRASIAYALEANAPSNRSGSAVSTRLPELVLLEVLDQHLALGPSADRGWLAALGDPLLAPALALIHGRPERPWTVADLATGAATSRSLLDERFRQVLGRSPIRYLTEWRMHLAQELLGSSDITVFELARRVGYRSEEAFARAFKRELGLPPGEWRRMRQNGPAFT